LALCLNVNTAQCLNLKNGVEKAGQPIQIWDINTAGKPGQFQYVHVGFVSSQRAWPFTPGSGMNALYNGSDVLEIVYSPGGPETSWCVGSSTFGTVEMTLQKCDTGAGSWTLISEVAPYLYVDVGASDYGGQGAYLYAPSSKNGTTVSLEGIPGCCDLKWTPFTEIWP
jgi:hypothetical protein